MPAKKPNQTPSGLADQLRAVAVARGVSAHRAAASAGLNPSVVSRFLSRERDLTLPSFERLCAALGVRVKLVEGRRPTK